MSNTFDLIRDLHKDARGVRPTSDWMEMFNATTERERERIWNSLCAELSDENAREQRAELEAQRVFETRIAGMMQDYGISRADAIRWDAESFDFDMDEVMEHWNDPSQEIEFLLWNQGIAHNMYPMYVAEFKQIYNVS